jgi:hypothetical protein
MSLLARCFVRARAVRSFAIAAQNVAQPAADASLNWALAKAGVIPKAQAFRNLSAQQLAKHEGSCVAGVFSSLASGRQSLE